MVGLIGLCLGYLAEGFTDLIGLKFQKSTTRSATEGRDRIFDFLIAGVQAPAFLLVFTGFTVGVVGGFIGVGGGYMVTPALIVFGFPGYMASGIDMTHIAGKGIVWTVRHKQLGNIDWIPALSMVAGTMFGVEEGIRLLGFFKHLGLSTVALLSASVVLMFTSFVYTPCSRLSSPTSVWSRWPARARPWRGR